MQRFQWNLSTCFGISIGHGHLPILNVPCTLLHLAHLLALPLGYFQIVVSRSSSLNKETHPQSNPSLGLQKLFGRLVLARPVCLACFFSFGWQLVQLSALRTRCYPGESNKGSGQTHSNSKQAKVNW